MSVPLPAPADAAAVLKQLVILEAVNIAFPIIAVAAFAARVFVRAGMLGRFTIDDWAMGVALILFIGNCATGVVLTHRQKGLFTGVITVAELPATLLDVQTLVRLVNTFYTLSIVAVKISLGFFFLHIFNVNQKLQRGSIYTLIALCTATGIVYVALIEGTCGIEFAFAATCTITKEFNAYSDAWSILNAVSDFVLTALSINALWGTQLRIYVKASAMALLALACLGGAISVVRAVTTIEPAKDSILQVLEIGRWSSIEGGIYIITGSLATLRPLLQRIWQVVTTTTNTAFNKSDTRTNVTGNATSNNPFERSTSIQISVYKGSTNHVTTVEVGTNNEKEVV